MLLLAALFFLATACVIRTRPGYHEGPSVHSHQKHQKHHKHKKEKHKKHR